MHSFANQKLEAKALIIGQAMDTVNEQTNNIN